MSPMGWISEAETATTSFDIHRVEKELVTALTGENKDSPEDLRDLMAAVRVLFRELKVKATAINPLLLEAYTRGLKME